MVLTDSPTNPRLFIFGVSLADREAIAISAGMVFFNGNHSKILELFDETGESWGSYVMPPEATTFFKQKLPAMTIFKSTNN